MSSQTSPSNVSTPAAHPQINQKPPAFMLPFMKMPLILYRMGLGWVFGKRFMQLTHVGCKSGKVYRSVLAVVHFDESTREILAVSPWSGSDWYRNIQAAPALEVETGRIRFTPVQRSLSPEEIAGAFASFRRQYPVFSRLVARIPGWKIDSTDEEFLALARTLRGVGFRPKN